MNYAHNTTNCGGHCLLELIRARAYQLFELRGRVPGHEIEDWLCAEREVRQQLGFEPPCKEKLIPLF